MHIKGVGVAPAARLLTEGSVKYSVVVKAAVSVMLFGLGTGAGLAGSGVWSSGWPSPSSVVTGVSVDSGEALTAYAATFAGSGGGGLFTSRDAGASWATPTLTSERLSAVAVGLPGVVYAGTLDGGMFKSVDSGATWVRLIQNAPSSQVASLRVDTLNPQIVYRVMSPTASSGGVTSGEAFRSNDGGSTWTSIENGLNSAFPLMSLDPHTSGTIYASTSSGVYRSTDFGADWSLLASSSVFGLGVDSLAVDAFTSSIIYAGTVSSGVLRSTDGGNTFHMSSTGLPSTTILSLVPDPVHAGRIFAGTGGSSFGTSGKGVFISLDSGVSWSPMNEGLSPVDIPSLAIDRTGTYLHAQTNAGVFDFQLGQLPVEILVGVVPVAISSGGAGSSFFRTSAQLRHAMDPAAQGQPGVTPVIGRLVFHRLGSAGAEGDSSLSFSLNAGAVLTISDLLAEMGVIGIGSVDVLESSGPPPIGILRVFNDAGAAGTFGFTEDLLKPADALNPGDRGILIAPPDTTQFRFNIGVRTLSAGATLTLTVRDSSGLLKRSVTRTFLATYMIQDTAANFLVDAATPQPLTLGPSDSITVQVASGNAIVYGASADNKTNDPSFQVAKRLP
jgi:hypothetical protein